MTDEELIELSQAEKVLGSVEHPELERYLELFADCLMRLAAEPCAPTPIETRLALTLAADIEDYTATAFRAKRGATLDDLLADDDPRLVLREVFADSENVLRIRTVKAQAMFKALEVARTIREGLNELPRNNVVSFGRGR